MKDRTVPAGEFKAKCLAILDHVNASRQAVLVTKRGRPVAKVVPVEQEDAFAALRGSVLEEKDIVSPLHEVWNVPR